MRCSFCESINHTYTHYVHGEPRCGYAERRQEISDSTAFDAGEQFSSEAAVRDYFTVENWIAMFRNTWDESPTQTELDAMAADVINHRWHCDFQIQ